MSALSDYIADIERGGVIVCEKIRKLYVGMLKPIVEGKDPEYYFNEKKASRFIRFAETFCRQSKGQWNRQTLKLLPYQKAKFEAVFGILRRSDDLRRFKEVFDVEARKNGKSEPMASLGLYMDIESPGAEVYVAATKFAQARRVWDEAKSMIAKSRDLQSLYTSRVFPAPEIRVSEYDSSFMALSKETRTQDGLNVSAAIIDEVHELPRAVYDILQQGTTSKDEPLIFMITTAGFVRKGLYDDKYDYSAKVLDGIIDDPTFLPIIYEQDSRAELDDEKTWVKSNPSLGSIKKWDALRDNVRKAKNDPNFMNTVLTKDFNFTGVDNHAWLDAETILDKTCYTKKEIAQFDNSTVLGGFDLSRTNDLTAFTTLIFDKAKGKIIAITQYWCTDDFIQTPEAKASGVPWQAWIERGLVRISGKHLIDYHDVANYVAGQFKEHGYTYEHIYYDSYSANYLIEELNQMGWSKDYCLVAAPQGFKTLSIPMQELQALLKAKRLVYQNNPVTAWMLSNIELVEDRNGNLMPTKADDKRCNKIDGPATILNGLVGYCQNKAAYLPESGAE